MQRDWQKETEVSRQVGDWLKETKGNGKIGRRLAEKDRGQQENEEIDKRLSERDIEKQRDWLEIGTSNNYCRPSYIYCTDPLYVEREKQKEREKESPAIKIFMEKHKSCNQGGILNIIYIWKHKIYTKHLYLRLMFGQYSYILSFKKKCAQLEDVGVKGQS